jgi:hypothetical protein
MVTAEVTHFAFHAALLVAPRWVAELRLDDLNRHLQDIMPDTKKRTAGAFG